MARRQYYCATMVQLGSAILLILLQAGLLAGGFLHEYQSGSDARALQPVISSAGSNEDQAVVGQALQPWHSAAQAAPQPCNYDPASPAALPQAHQPHVLPPPPASSHLGEALQPWHSAAHSRPQLNSNYGPAHSPYLHQAHQPSLPPPSDSFHLGQVLQSFSAPHAGPQPISSYGPASTPYLHQPSFLTPPSVPSYLEQVLRSWHSAEHARQRPTYSYGPAYSLFLHHAHQPPLPAPSDSLHLGQVLQSLHSAAHARPHSTYSYGPASSPYLHQAHQAPLLPTHSDSFHIGQALQAGPSTEHTGPQPPYIYGPTHPASLPQAHQSHASSMPPDSSHLGQLSQSGPSAPYAARFIHFGQAGGQAGPSAAHTGPQPNYNYGPTYPASFPQAHQLDVFQRPPDPSNSGQVFHPGPSSVHARPQPNVSYGPTHSASLPHAQKPDVPPMASDSSSGKVLESGVSATHTRPQPNDKFGSAYSKSLHQAHQPDVPTPPDSSHSDQVIQLSPSAADARPHPNENYGPLHSASLPHTQKPDISPTSPDSSPLGQVLQSGPSTTRARPQPNDNSGSAYSKSLHQAQQPDELPTLPDSLSIKKKKKFVKASRKKEPFSQTRSRKRLSSQRGESKKKRKLDTLLFSPPSHDQSDEEWPLIEREFQKLQLGSEPPVQLLSWIASLPCPLKFAVALKGNWIIKFVSFFEELKPDINSYQKMRLERLAEGIWNLNTTILERFYLRRESPFFFQEQGLFRRWYLNEIKKASEPTNSKSQPPSEENGLRNLNVVPSFTTQEPLLLAHGYSSKVDINNVPQSPMHDHSDPSPEEDRKNYHLEDLLRNLDQAGSDHTTWQADSLKKKSKATQLRVTATDLFITKVAIDVLGTYYKTMNQGKWKEFFPTDSLFLTMLKQTQDNMFRSNRSRRVKNQLTDGPVFPWGQNFSKLGPTIQKFALPEAEYDSTPIPVRFVRMSEELEVN
ncbi:hypothetical protein O181_013462 [Austropuccinia psidii MF-1]|uniref:Uncharacterized protein n=1 Tax=Austropuccinia psidii MF-1 TaxID=1389203 RepID=A0A9Q3BZP2_9BASI|nr:hypothetical protein [Austropuccinia psidii MF-1]